MKIVAYLRLSTDKQDEQSQREQLARWAESNSRTIDKIIVDRASGGTPWQERQLANVLDMLMPGDMIVVSEVSRIARSTAGVLTFVQAALTAQVAVVAVAQRMAFDHSLNSHITLTVLGLCAEIERSLLRDRTKAALAARRAAGQRLGRPPGSRSASKLDKRADEIARLVKAGVAIRAIARLIPCSPTTLYHWLGEPRT